MTERTPPPTLEHYKTRTLCRIAAEPRRAFFCKSARAVAGDTHGVKESWQLFESGAQSSNYHRQNLSLNLDISVTNQIYLTP